MTPPIAPEALQKVLQTLPPEDPDPFSHLACLRRDAIKGLNGEHSKMVGHNR